LADTGLFEVQGTYWLGAGNSVRENDGRFVGLLANEGAMGSDDKPIVLVSGGFDPLHSGHVAMIAEAARYGDVFVALNSDEWLIRKKGYVFMPWEERKKILLALYWVNDVIQFNDNDDTVCDALRQVKPQYFANGGDRTSPNYSEHQYCKRHSIIELFGIGGEKTNSSSKLMEKAFDNYKNTLSN